MSANTRQPATKPLLDWVLEKYPGTPRRRAKQWIVSGRVKVDGVVLRKPHQLIAPDSSLELIKHPAALQQPGDIWQIHPQVALLHLDSSLAIVNKGAGIISVPAPKRGISALSVVGDFLAGRWKPPNGRRTCLVPASYRGLEPLPVHRLDEYTSGLFCLALSPTARQHLIDQVHRHSMRREYIAFVEGRSSSRKGTWRHWLRLSPDGQRQQVLLASPKVNSHALTPLPQPPDSASPLLLKVHKRSRTFSRPVPAETVPRHATAAVQAITHFEVLAEYAVPTSIQWITKLRLKLETGCRHQIRIQAATAGLPLVGDRTYNPRYQQRNNRKDNRLDRIEFPRQALHAELLELEHPEQPGRRLSWEAQLPKDLRQFEAQLGP